MTTEAELYILSDRHRTWSTRHADVVRKLCNSTTPEDKRFYETVLATMKEPPCSGSLSPPSPIAA